MTAKELVNKLNKLIERYGDKEINYRGHDGVDFTVHTIEILGGNPFGQKSYEYYVVA